jgi:DNA-directed RNA polymerase subunit RPC12/RpoP
MGMYDTIMAACPRCGTKNGFQSKGGDCDLSTYELDEAPADVLSDANRHPMLCSECGTRYRIVVKTITMTSVAEY